MKTSAATAFLLCVAACSSGPSPQDVKADRDRWTAVRDATVDGIIDKQEAPALAELLVAWDAKLTADEKAAGSERSVQTIVADLVRVYGQALVLMFLGPELQKRAPDLFALLDVNRNGSLEIDELAHIDPTSPVFALVVTTTVAELLRKHHR
jgi:hypothetical protein